MTYFKTFSRLQQFFILFFSIITFITLIFLRHLSVALLWGIALTLTLYSPSLRSFFKTLRHTLKKPVYILCMILVGWSLASTIWSINPIQSFKASLSFGATLFLYSVILTHLQSWERHMFTPLLRMLLPLLFLSSIFLLAQNINGTTIKTLLGLKWSALKPNIILFITLSIPVAAALHTTYRKKIIPILLILLSLALCYKSEYQTAFIGLVVASFAGFLGYRFSRRIPLISAYLSAFLCITLPSLMQLIIPLFNLKVIEGMDPLRSFAHRLAIWDFVIKHIKEKLILGWGAATSKGFPTQNRLAFDGTSILPSHPHNHILQVWLEMGLIGALILAALHFYLFRTIAKLNNPLATGWAMCFTVLTFFILNFSHSIWHKWWVTWVGVMWILLLTLIQHCSLKKTPDTKHQRALKLD